MNRIATMKGCLAGKILRIDLSDGRIWTEETDKYAMMTLGGRGINSLIMIKEIPSHVKWYDPENLLCFGVGSLVGTMVPGANRVDVSSINVFDGGKGSANVGGFWGAELKYAGYDNIIIVGKSEQPVYLYINDSDVEIRDASFIWGKTVFETERILRQELHDDSIRIACVGPAGENRVRGSAIMIDSSKAAAGSGVGCVMGDKRLKAIVVRGHGKIQVAEPERFMREIAKLYQQSSCEPATEMMRRAPLNLYSDPEWQGWDTNIVVRNGQDDQWEREKRVRLMGPTTGVPSMVRGVRACFSCPAGCMPYVEIREGKYEGRTGEGFWINTIMGHACRFDISDPESVVESWLLTNELGLDGDYVAGGLSWVFELYEKGIITKKDTDNLELTWGNADALHKLIEMLAYRKGIGDLLADGMLEAAKMIGHDSEYYLIQVKGQPSIEPFRIPKGWALAVATSPVAGRHLRGSTMGSNKYGPKPRLGDFNVTDYQNQAKGVVWQGKTKELEDNLGICSYLGTWSGANCFAVGDFAELVNAGMGLDLTEEELMNQYAVTGRNLEKAFNTLHTDMSRKDDLPPKRYREEEVKSGPHKGSKIEEESYMEMLDEFYELWGWDRETGMQTKTGLESLGLKDIAQEIAKQGKLIDR
jgi:aldehyde:ferredoxin oxidoreductase